MGGGQPFDFRRRRARRRIPIPLRLEPSGATPRLLGGAHARVCMNGYGREVRGYTDWKSEEDMAESVAKE